ncbi:hypothetical protein [Oceaniglobus trochenteri]|uniref:hypothetical protein n=1 Tax=Oceaniglobus trochenteri TaxID=2763260 RepID=UPI001CFFAE10|nr:hypothetical protein [Oceaniglobus trochenteri]
MDRDTATRVLETLERKAEEASIETETLMDWPNCGPDVPMRRGLGWLAGVVFVVAIWPLICLWLATWWVL